MQPIYHKIWARLKDFIKTRHLHKKEAQEWAKEKKSLINMIKDTETKLKYSEERWGMILEVAGEGLWEWYIDEGIVYHNKRWCRILQLDESYISHSIKKFVDLIHPEDRERVLHLINQAIKEQGEYFSEHRMLRHDGSTIWVVDRGVFVKGLEEKQQRMIGSISDINKEKRAQQELFLEKEIFQSTLLSVGEGVISTDVNRRITIFNPVAEELTGWKQKEVIGRDIDEIIRIIHPESKEPIRQLISFKFSDDLLEDYNSQALLLTRTGKEVAIFESVAPIHMTDGEIIGFVIIIRDITEVVERQKKSEYLSFHDGLTGLYNRRYMEDALNRLDTSRNLPFTIMVLDLNYLKLINDVFGHAMGDRFIKKIAEVLKDVLRAEDLISRIGGDEFCVLLPKTSKTEAEIIKKRIQNATSLYQVDSLCVSVSVGYAIKTKEFENIGDTLGAADANMYKDKQNNNWQVKWGIINNFIENNYEKCIMEKQHDERVSVLASALYEALGKSPKEAKEFQKVVQLHDIGKIIVPNGILNKEEELTIEEWEIIRRHPLASYQVLRVLNEYSPYAEAILYHHEHFDGRGYPEGLIGDAIPLESRVIAVADAYEAMTSERPYKKGKSSKEEAIVELIRNSGKQFDPVLIGLFIGVVLPKIK